MPDLTLENIPNFRDLGATINEITGKPLLKEGLFFRSGRLDSATPHDLRTLAALPLRTVLDLRTTTEHRLHPPPAAPWRTHAISLISRGLQHHLLRLLPWYLQLYVLLLLVLGQRVAVHRIIGERVITPMGLGGLSVLALRYARRELREVLEVLSEESAYPVLVHCTQGKDRTGVVAMLVLWVCGVWGEAVRREYARSAGVYGEGSEGVGREVSEEVAGMGLAGEEFMGVDEDVVDLLWGEVEKEGGVEAFLDGIGFGAEKRERLRKIMCVE